MAEWVVNHEDASLHVDVFHNANHNMQLLCRTILECTLCALRKVCDPSRNDGLRSNVVENIHTREEKSDSSSRHRTSV